MKMISSAANPMIAATMNASVESVEDDDVGFAVESVEGEDVGFTVCVCVCVYGKEEGGGGEKIEEEETSGTYREMVRDGRT